MRRDGVGMRARDDAMTRLRVMIPTYAPDEQAAVISSGTMSSLERLQAAGLIRDTDVLVHENNGLLVQARAELLARAYADGSADAFLFLDADIGIGVDAVRHMLEAPTASVGCAYAGRHAGMTRSILGRVAQPQDVRLEGGQRLLRMRWLAFGCMLLTRPAVDALYRTCEHFETYEGCNAISPWSPLIITVDGKRRLLDDSYACCERLTACGVDTWCLVDECVVHAGIACQAGRIVAA